MWVLWPLVHLQMMEELPSERSLGQHTLDRSFNDALWNSLHNIEASSNLTKFLLGQSLQATLGTQQARYKLCSPWLLRLLLNVTCTSAC